MLTSDQPELADVPDDRALRAAAGLAAFAAGQETGTRDQAPAGSRASSISSTGMSSRTG